MAKEYIGIGGVARKVGKMYIGVNGVARKIKKAYIGVNGVARLCYSSGMAVGDSVTLTSSQTWVVPITGTYQRTLIGGGGGGGDGYAVRLENGVYDVWGGGGGGSGYSDVSVTELYAGMSFDIVIGAGGAHMASGSTTTAFNRSASGGSPGAAASSGSVGTGGAGGSTGSDGSYQRVYASYGNLGGSGGGSGYGAGGKGGGGGAVQLSSSQWQFIANGPGYPGTQGSVIIKRIA